MKVLALFMEVCHSADAFVFDIAAAFKLNAIFAICSTIGLL